MIEHDDIPWMLETIKRDIKSRSGISGGAHNARPPPAVNQQLLLRRRRREKLKDREKYILDLQFLFFLILKSEGIKRETLWNFKKGF